MVLQQHEAAQFRPKVAGNPSRHRREDGLPVGREPPPASARRSPPAGVRSGPQGRHATALKGGSSREPTCLEQIGSAMSKCNLAHHTCPAFCPRYSRTLEVTMKTNKSLNTD